MVVWDLSHHARTLAAINLSRCCKRIRPKSASWGLGHIERVFVRRQTNTIGRFHGEDSLYDVLAIDGRIVDARAIPIPRTVLSVVCKPESTFLVEYDIVWTYEWIAVTIRIKLFNNTRFNIALLDSTGRVIRRLVARKDQSSTTAAPFETSVITDVTVTIGPTRSAVGTTAGF